MTPLKNERVISVIMLAILLLSARGVFAEDDKVKHFGVSAMFGAGADTYLHYRTELKAVARIPLSTILGSLPGLAKEIIDSNEVDNSFSSSDMTANLAGAFVGAMVSSIFNDTIQIMMKHGKEKRVAILATYRF